MTKLKALGAIVVSVLLAAAVASAQYLARDPGVRGGEPGAGGALAGLDGWQAAFFSAGLEAFSEEDSLAEGLGPRFNLTSCGGCHSQPAIGGAGPPRNPPYAPPPPFPPQPPPPSFL